jgi:membrane-associated phospholipid phosphatase
MEAYEYYFTSCLLISLKMLEKIREEFFFLKNLLISSWDFFLKHKIKFLIFVLIVTLITVFIFPNDKTILKAITPNDQAPKIAHQLSYWGDFLTGTLIISVGIWLGGIFLKKKYWRHAAIACLLAAAIAGITVNCFRLTLGRPRPSAETVDGFYGLKKDYKYHGFPSGHAATAFGTSTALSVTFPPLAIPATVAATGVGWARMRLNRHYLTDIIVGGAFGIMFGICLGFTVRRND